MTPNEHQVHLHCLKTSSPYKSALRRRFTYLCSEQESIVDAVIPKTKCLSNGIGEEGVVAREGEEDETDPNKEKVFPSYTCNRQQ